MSKNETDMNGKIWPESDPVYRQLIGRKDVPWGDLDNGHTGPYIEDSMDNAHGKIREKRD